MRRPYGSLAYDACIEGRCTDEPGTCPRIGQVWPTYVKYNLEHDQTCESLDDMWRPTYGGVSCPSDLFDCDDCKIMFFVEGMRLVKNGGLDLEDGEGYDLELCECCYRSYQRKST